MADKPTVVLVLQGGGALGAYHVGAVQALEDAGFAPDWLCGISIGAVNAAVLAGNKPADRLGRLEELWHEISRPDYWGAALTGGLREVFNAGSNWEALVLGQPHFFAPRLASPFLAPAGSPAATSFYDTSPLRDTLERLADFETIAEARTRLSLGATNVATGDLAFFDNRIIRLRPEHVLASASLPPGFPATRVGDAAYWDGACVSNTPLDAVLLDQPPGRALVFMIDLWSEAGPVPTTMNDVLWRAKQIQYASRTAHGVESVAAKLALRQHAEKRAAMEIVHIVYHPAADQIPNSDAEFSRVSLAERRAAGLADMRLALSATGGAAHGRVVVHKVAHGAVTTREDFTQPRPGVGFAR